MPAAMSTAAGLRAAFDAVTPLTVGVEEEVMLLERETLDLAPCAGKLLARLAGDARFKPELPAAQVEIRTDPEPEPAAAASSLAGARRVLAEAAAGLTRPAVAGVHPFAAPFGELSSGERYAHVRAEYGPVARTQLVSSLQVHVAVGGADRTLAVYNGLRSHLPEIAALAANAPVYAGGDSGLASVRPKICELLPRQGVPPAFETWGEFAAALRWGASAGSFAEPRLWWWELRPHPTFGTLEVRVPDAQTTVGEAGGVIATVWALVVALSRRHDGNESLPVAPTWRIEQNRWSAARHGLDGTMADLASGAPEPTRERLLRMLAWLEEETGGPGTLAAARRLVEENGAIRQRKALAADGATGVAVFLADRFTEQTKFGANGLRE